MPIYYYKLMDMLNRRGIKKKDFLTMANISNATMAKLTNNKVVQTDVIDRVCAALNCQPGDIMEYAEDNHDNLTDA
jgi:DNA-binding Xre family transcriptional regulator